MITENEIISLFDKILEPKLIWPIKTLNLLKEIKIDEEKLYLKINLITVNEEEIANFRKNLTNVLEDIFYGEIILELSHLGVSTVGIDGIKKIILVASGKGGVGKSTISVNLSAALAKTGKSVGLLDADIYGPSIPIMLGAKGNPEVMDDENLLPMNCHGIKFISAASLVPKGQAMEWRGQLVSGMIVQFIKKTFWGELDYLIVDLPPGTGDIHLTIASRIKANGVVLVTTPQEVVWGDVQRAIDQVKKQQIPILGVVENMSYTICEECGHKNFPFSTSKKELSEGIPILARIPLTKEVSECCDTGIPFVFKFPDSDIGKTYLDLAEIIEKK